MWRTILLETQSESFTFKTREGSRVLLIDRYQGGTWTLQALTPWGDWVDTNVTFDSDGIKAFVTDFGITYRLAGGDVGARAVATGVFDLA